MNLLENHGRTTKFYCWSDKDFVEEYFEKDEEKNNADDETSHRWDEAWEKEVERRLED